MSGTATLEKRQKKARRGQRERGRVDWRKGHASDLCVKMILQGFHYAFIAEYLGLSTGQVQYRAYRLGVSSRSYRNGEGDFAGKIIGKIVVLED